MRQTLSDYDDRTDEGFTLLSEARAPEAAPPPPDRRLPKIILTAGAMAVFAGGLWFAYVEGTHHVTATNGNTVVAQSDGVPLLRADTQPSKVKPDQPGGMNVPDQNVSLYNDKPGAAPVEKLLPGPERLMPRPASPPPPPPPPPVAVQPAAPVAPTPAAPGSPNATARALDKSPAGKAKPPAPEKQAKQEKPPAAETKPETKVEPKTAAKPAVAPPKADAAKAGPVLLRLASLRTPEAAKEQWAKLKRENPDILGNVRAVAVRTDLGDKGVFYRIEAGPFADSGVAGKICSEMKRRNLGCLLAR